MLSLLVRNALSLAQTLRHAMPRLPAALMMVIFPRLVSPRASTAHRPRPLPSVQPASSVAKHHRVQVQCAFGLTEGAYPCRGDGDGAMVMTGFATPKIHKNRRGHGVARGAHQRSSLRLTAGTFVSGLREPDGGGDARRARHFCEHPTLVFL